MDYEGKDEGLAGSVPARETELAKVLQKLHRITEVSMKEFEGLKSRLSPILNNNPSTDGRAEKDQEFSTKLAQEVNTVVSKIEILVERIRTTKNALEL